MSILDEMRNEQQETEPSSTASNLSEPTNADVIAAVNRQTKAVNGLKSYLRFAIEETVKEELKALPSTSQPSVNRSSQIESVESRLSEIESTLRVFAQSLDGKQLQSASQSLIAEAQMNRAATASATEKLQSLAEDSQKLMHRVGGAVQRIESRLGWVAAGRMALALIPVGAIALMILALIVPVGQVLGVGPLFSWAWSVVWDSSVFWVWRVFMALATLGALAGFGWCVARVAVPFSVWLDARVRSWGR